MVSVIFLKKSTFVPHLILLACLSDVEKIPSKMERYSLLTLYASPERVRGVPKQKTILNLGKDFPIEKKDWNEVTDRVEARLKKGHYRDMCG